MRDRHLFADLLRRLEGVAVLALLPGLVVAAAVLGSGWQGVVRAWPRWRRLAARGLRDFRERWWLQTRFESTGCLWRYFLLAECAALGRRLPVEPANRILVLRLGHIGDLLHAVPAFRALKKKNPAVVVDILVGPWSAGLARKFDCFDDVIVYNPAVMQFNRGNREAARGFWSELAFLRRLNRRSYRAAVCASNLHFCELAVLQAVRAAELWGVAPEFPLYPPAWGTEHVRPFDSRMHEADWVGACLAPVDVPAGPFELEYPIDAAARERATRLLNKLGVSDGDRCAVLAPGAGWPGKLWPVARFAEFGNWLAAERGWRLLVAGSAGERALGEDLCRKLRGPCVNLAGQTTLDELAAILARSELFIGNDSGPMHLAAAVGVPTISFWGPTFPEKWAPRGPKHLILRASTPCAGCVYWHPRAVCVGKPPCIETIPFDPEVIRRFLQNVNPSCGVVSERS